MIFYKYTGDWGLKILEELRLKIAPPNEFNDPFELTPRSKFKITINDMIEKSKSEPEHFRAVFENLKCDGYSGSFEQFIRDFPEMVHQMGFSRFKKLMISELAKKDMRSLDEASKKFGILCVSKTHNSIPMWSYYANHHRGIAIGLDCSQIGKALPGPHFWKVKYRTARRGVNPWLNPSNPEWLKQVLDTIFIKSREWGHEQEYRRVFQLAELIHAPPDDKGNRHYFLDINGSNIRTIIFGCRVNQAIEDGIRSEFERRPKTFGHIKLFRCIRHKAKFELEIVPAD